MTPPFCRRWRAPVEMFYVCVYPFVLSVESSSTIRVCGVLAYTRTAFNVCVSLVRVVRPWFCSLLKLASALHGARIET